MKWYCTSEYAVGFLPSMLSEDDPRPAREQFHEHYAHGGGWRPIKNGFSFDGEDIINEESGARSPVGFTKLREEVILVYRGGYVCIQQPDGTHEIARMY